MAANPPVMGRPRRPEHIRRLKLRESTYNLWNQRKEALGIHGITNSEFAEILLHQNVSTRQHRERSPGYNSSGTQRQGTLSNCDGTKLSFVTCFPTALHYQFNVWFAKIISLCLLCASIKSTLY